MAVTDEDVKRARQDALNEKNQRRMEQEVYGEMTPENPSVRGKRLTYKELEGATDRPVQKYPSKSLKDMMEPLPLPKPGKTVEPQTLPGKPEKKKSLGEGATNYAKGGTASARADGCAQRGKTRGKMV